MCFEYIYYYLMNLLVTNFYQVFKILIFEQELKSCFFLLLDESKTLLNTLIWSVHLRTFFATSLLFVIMLFKKSYFIVFFVHLYHDPYFWQIIFMSFLVARLFHLLFIDCPLFLRLICCWVKQITMNWRPILIWICIFF